MSIFPAHKNVICRNFWLGRFQKFEGMEEWIDAGLEEDYSVLSIVNLDKEYVLVTMVKNERIKNEKI